MCKDDHILAHKMIAKLIRASDQINFEVYTPAAN